MAAVMVPCSVGIPGQSFEKGAHSRNAGPYYQDLRNEQAARLDCKDARRSIIATLCLQIACKCASYRLHRDGSGVNDGRATAVCGPAPALPSSHVPPRASRPRERCGVNLEALKRSEPSLAIKESLERGDLRQKTEKRLTNQLKKQLNGKRVFAKQDKRAKAVDELFNATPATARPRQKAPTPDKPNYFDDVTKSLKAKGGSEESTVIKARLKKDKYVGEIRQIPTAESSTRELAMPRYHRM